jgi:head-tail adaptor
MATPLDNLRSAQSRRLTQSCIVYNRAETGNALGRKTYVYNAGPTYACRVQPITAREQPAGDRPIQRADASIVLPWNAVVTENDRLNIGGTYYEVTGTNGDQADRMTLTCDCTRVR